MWIVMGREGHKGFGVHNPHLFWSSPQDTSQVRGSAHRSNSAEKLTWGENKGVANFEKVE